MKNANGIGQKLWDFACSLKLTIVVLILLAITSIIGTVIEQGKAPETYIQRYGETTYQLFETLDFFNMYHSWWFVGLLALFSLNLIACSVKRLPLVMRYVTEPAKAPGEGFFKTLSNVGTFGFNGTKEQAEESVSALFSEKLATPDRSERNGEVLLFAEKGVWSRFGVYVTHASILVIFLGAIIGAQFGYKAWINIVEGTSSPIVWPRGASEPIQLGFEVRCEDFSVTYYENSGRPKEFKSILSVIENGEVVIKDRPIIVNDPLQYKGVTFYQSSYGPAGDPTIDLRITEKATGQTRQLRVRQGEWVPLAGVNFQVQAYTPSYEDFGPAIRMAVRKPGEMPKTFIVMQNYPDFDKRRGGELSFAMMGYDELQYTGLQVAKDPGVWVVWVGCTLLVLGSFVAFFLSHRRLWARIYEQDGTVQVQIGGSAHRNQPAFALFFDGLKEGLEERLKS